jgi:phospholipid/cholesterol/gamma-HCH transport system substrate-binding protein
LREQSVKRNIAETLLGSTVIVVAAGFFIFALQATDVDTFNTYNLNARFLKVGGLEVGSDVRISGVRVGTVTNRRFDPENFEAVVQLKIGSKIQLPADTQAVVTSEGILGDK